MTLREQMERAYQRLDDLARRAFDRVCAGRAREHGNVDTRAARDDHAERLARAIERATEAAEARYEHGLAASDFHPTAANEAINARYLATAIATGYDLDAADEAVRDELRWQVERLGGRG